MSKFFEAMRNPNWRNRGPLDDSKDSEYLDLPPWDEEPKGRDKSAEEDDGEEHRFSSATQLLGRFFESATEMSHGLSDHRDSFMQRSSSLETDDSTDYTEAKNLCAVKSHQPVGSLGMPRSMSLIEVVPFYSDPTPSSEPQLGNSRRVALTANDFVQVRRIGNNPSSDKTYSYTSLGRNQHEQLAAVLKGADETPEKLKRSPHQGVSLEEDNSVTSIPEIPSLEALLFEDSSSRPFRSKKEIEAEASPAGENDGFQECPRGPKDDDAFQRMLRKLHKHGPAEPNNEMKNMATEKERRNDETGKPSTDTQKRTVNTSSDSGYASLLQEASLPSKAQEKNHTLSANCFNPRAREFLSLGPKEFGEAVNHPEYRKPVRPPLAGLFNLPEGLASSHWAANGNETKPMMPVPVSSFAGLGDAPPELLTSGLKPSIFQPLTPLPVGTKVISPVCTTTNPGGAWGPGQTTGFPLPLPASIGMGMSSGDDWQGKGPMAPMMPAMISVMPPPASGPPPPFQDAAPQALSVPPPGSQLGSSVPPPRYPVPKPRRPDAGNQQEYEAWIEWRKANEPGYAMECKMRQQRRAQRNVGNKTIPRQERRNVEVKSTA